ncbi:MAG: DUF883 family protein [Balneolaceae bacterium]|nr:DUF883 family protein [Balneolaceae bacterium]
MADLKAKEKELKEALQKEKEELKNTYEDIRKRLKSESDRLQGDIQKEYDQAKKYVKQHPETGVGIALAGGLLIGFALAKLLNR